MRFEVLTTVKMETVVVRLMLTFPEEVTAGIWGTEVTMEVECIYGTVVTIYQTIRCHNPVGHNVLYGEFLSIAIDMPF